MTDVRETDDSLTITVKSLGIALWAQTAVGYRRVLEVELRAPLGDRTVIDGTGQVVPPYSPPEPRATDPGT